MSSVISAHEARLKAARTPDADRAYAAVSTTLRHAYARVRVASDRGESSVMFTVMPEFHGFNGVHGPQAAREVAVALRRKGFKVVSMSAADMLISWHAEETGRSHKADSKRAERKGGRGGDQIAEEDLWRFGPRGT